MQGSICSECLRFDDNKCLLGKGACLNYDKFMQKPIIVLWRSDFETKYISRASFDEMKARAESAEARVAELEEAASAFFGHLRCGHNEKAHLQMLVLQELVDEGRKK